MHLLVSVSDAAEAAAALSGGADVIDAKDPLAGPLGAVSIEVFRAIHHAVGGGRLVSAALGDASVCDRVESDARTFAIAGASLVKVGVAGVTSVASATSLFRCALRGVAVETAVRPGSVQGCGVIAVAYADAARANSLPPDAVLDAAVDAGVHGVLLDTFDKHGRGLRDLVTIDVLAEWVRRSKHAGFLVALAGRLEAADLSWVRAAGADVAGVRGAACDGGRAGRITSDRVRALRWQCDVRDDRQAGPRLPAAAAPTGSI